MTAQIYHFLNSFNDRFRAAARQAMGFTVSIEQENIRSGMRLLSRLFPEMSPLESDAAVLFTQNDFNNAANPVTKIIQYGAPFIAPDKSLRVVMSNQNIMNETPLFSISSVRPENTEAIVLPTSWGGNGPYIIVSDAMSVSEPTLLSYLKAYSESQQADKFEPLRSKIARAMDGQIIVKDNSNIAIPSMTLRAPISGLQEARIR